MKHKKFKEFFHLCENTREAIEKEGLGMRTSNGVDDDAKIARLISRIQTYGKQNDKELAEVASAQKIKVKLQQIRSSQSNDMMRQKRTQDEAMAKMMKTIIKDVICFDAFFDVSRWFMLRRIWINNIFEMFLNVMNDSFAQDRSDGDITKTIDQDIMKILYNICPCATRQSEVHPHVCDDDNTIIYEIQLKLFNQQHYDTLYGYCAELDTFGLIELDTCAPERQGTPLQGLILTLRFNKIILLIANDYYRELDDTTSTIMIQDKLNEQMSRAQAMQRIDSLQKINTQYKNMLKKMQQLEGMSYPANRSILSVYRSSHQQRSSFGSLPMSHSFLSSGDLDYDVYFSSNSSGIRKSVKAQPWQRSQTSLQQKSQTSLSQDDEERISPHKMSTFGACIVEDEDEADNSPILQLQNYILRHTKEGHNPYLSCIILHCNDYKKFSMQFEHDGIVIASKMGKKRTQDDIFIKVSYGTLRDIATFSYQNNFLWLRGLTLYCDPVEFFVKLLKYANTTYTSYTHLLDVFSFLEELEVFWANKQLCLDHELCEFFGRRKVVIFKSVDSALLQVGARQQPFFFMYNFAQLNEGRLRMRSINVVNRKVFPGEKENLDEQFQINEVQTQLSFRGYVKYETEYDKPLDFSKFFQQGFIDGTLGLRQEQKKVKNMKIIERRVVCIQRC